MDSENNAGLSGLLGGSAGAVLGGLLARRSPSKALGLFGLAANPRVEKSVATAIGSGYGGMLGGMTGADMSAVPAAEEEGSVAPLLGTAVGSYAGGLGGLLTGVGLGSRGLNKAVSSGGNVKDVTLGEFPKVNFETQVNRPAIDKGLGDLLEEKAFDTTPNGVRFSKDFGDDSYETLNYLSTNPMNPGKMFVPKEILATVRENKYIPKIDDGLVSYSNDTLNKIAQTKFIEEDPTRGFGGIMTPTSRFMHALTTGDPLAEEYLRRGLNMEPEDAFSILSKIRTIKSRHNFGIDAEDTQDLQALFQKLFGGYNG